MARYVIWDKQSDIYVPAPNKDHGGKMVWSAEDYIDTLAPWAKNPSAKVIVSGSIINGSVIMEFSATVEYYKRLGAPIADGMTDEEVLAAIEAFEDTPQEAPPSAEERIAAALEFQNLLSM